MKKPLSYGKYYSGNKKIVIRYIATIIITAVILAVIQIILDNIGNEICNNDVINDYVIAIKNKENSVISEDIITEIKSIKGVEKVIPKKQVGINFMAFASTPDSSVFAIRQEDMEDFLDALNIEYDSEVLKSLKENETYISKRLVKNKNLRKGDKLDDSYDLTYKAYHDTDLMIGITPMEFIYGSNEYIVIPKKGEVNNVTNELKRVLKDKCIIDNNNKINKISLDNTVGTFNSVKMIITITCAIATGVTTYLHYFNRRKEIGVLKAIGYSDKKILIRISKEILISSLVSLILSLGLINVIVYLLNTFVAEPNGYLNFIFNISMLSDMVVVVLYIMVFSLVPTWILLKSVDKISLIEGR